MTTDPGSYDATPPDADDYWHDRAVERDQEVRVLGAPADYLTPGEFEAARLAAIDRNRARRGVFASVPHTTAEDMVVAAMNVAADLPTGIEYRPQIGSPDHALTVGAGDRRIADAVRVLRTAELNGLTADSDEWARLMGQVRDRADEAMRTGLMGGDAA